MTEKIWLLSIRLNNAHFSRLAKLLQRLNVLLHGCDLSCEADVASDVKLFHHGLGVVVHGRVSIAPGVRIVHHVTIGVVAGNSDRPAGRVEIGTGVQIGVGATLLAQANRTLIVGNDARIGAGALITQNVDAGATMLAPTARRRD